MSHKRKTLGFDDDSDEDSEPVEVIRPLKKTVLPKLKFSTVSFETQKATEDEATDENLTKTESNDYLDMQIEEDENSKPRKLQTVQERPPTDYNFENIKDVSLFGQVNQAEQDKSESSLLTPLPNNQLPISKKSKGLSIMEKMGFKVGQTLGKDSNNKSALLEPITTIPRSDRSGINEKKESPQEKYIPTEGITEEDALKFRTRLKEEQNEKGQTTTYHTMQKYCYQFSGDADEDIEKINPKDINVIWRGYVKFIQNLVRKKKAERELEGKEEEEGANIAEEDENNEEKEEDEDEELKLFEELDLSSKIERLNMHLRSEYNYCYYCGAKYEDQQDLFQNCPGQTEEEHN